jgi:hypothetical protein
MEKVQKPSNSECLMPVLLASRYSPLIVNLTGQVLFLDNTLFCTCPRYRVTLYLVCQEFLNNNVKIHLT